MPEQMCDQCYSEWAAWLDYRGVHAVQIQQTGQPGLMTEVVNTSRVVSTSRGTHIRDTTRLVSTTGRRMDIRDTIIRQQDLIVSLCHRTPRPHRWVPNGRSRRIVEVPA